MPGQKMLKEKRKKSATSHRPLRMACQPRPVASPDRMTADLVPNSASGKDLGKQGVRCYVYLVTMHTCCVTLATTFKA